VLLFAIYLVIVIALPLAMSTVVGFRGLPRGIGCPNCSHETLPVVSILTRALHRMHAALSLQRRWCPTCEWDGYARVSVAPAAVVIPVQGGTRHTQQVRTLELGGRAWRVLLESWRDRDRYYGRLLFVGPSGKLWYDPFASLSASTHGEVVRQALSLSDRLLAYRLREVISG
jgi:hypothetical protein